MRWIMVDKIVECIPGEKAVGVKCFSLSDPIFMDHFPELPIVPGVIQVEMMAHTAGKCIRLKNTKRLPLLASVKSAKFFHRVQPGDQCFMHMQITRLKEDYGLAEGYTLVNEKKVSESSLMFAMIDAPTAKSKPQKLSPELSQELSYEDGFTDYVMNSFLNESLSTPSNTGFPRK